MLNGLRTMPPTNAAMRPKAIETEQESLHRMQAAKSELSHNMLSTMILHHEVI